MSVEQVSEWAIIKTKVTTLPSFLFPVILCNITTNHSTFILIEKYILFLYHK